MRCAGRGQFHRHILIHDLPFPDLRQVGRAARDGFAAAEDEIDVIGEGFGVVVGAGAEAAAGVFDEVDAGGAGFFTVGSDEYVKRKIDGGWLSVDIDREGVAIQFEVEGEERAEYIGGGSGDGGDECMAGDDFKI